MTVRLPDPRGSRAVLIGTSSYDSPDLKPLLAVRNNLEVLNELLTSDNGGFLPGRCTVVQDSAAPQEVCRTIREAAHDAPDTLLVYFSGHGILNYDYSDLHLALTGTDQGDLRWTSVPFRAIREIFETAACRNKILILDCCQSGWVLDTMMGAPNGEPTPLDIRGTYLLTSSSADLKSYAPPEDRYTAFTGELIKLLRDGVPGGPELLPLSTLFDPLATALKRRSMPRPQQQGSDDHAALALVRNMAATRHDEAGDPAQQAVWERESGRRVPETRLAYDVWKRRVWQWSIGLPTTMALAWFALRFGQPNGLESVDIPSQRGIVTVAALGGIFLVVEGLSRSRPADYSLVITTDGIEIRYNKSHFYYPWHRVSRVWVVARPRGRLRGTQYALLLRPKRGVLIKTGRRIGPGPRRDKETGALHLANLKHLNAPPAAVEKSLARNAGSAWTPSSGSLGRPRPAKAAVEVFSTDRYLLTVVAAAAAAAALGWSLVPKRGLTQPVIVWGGILPLFFSAAAFGVLWFCVSRIVRPVRLEISAAGVALTRSDLEISYAWSEIEQIGIINWPRGMDSLGLLALRPTPQAGHGHGDRTTAYLPKLALGCITLCTLPEVTRNPRILQTALQRFASESQITPAGHAWLRSTPAKVARASRAAAAVRGGTTFAGLRSQGTAVALGFVLAAPSFGLAFWKGGDRDVPALLATLNTLVLTQLPLPGLLAYFFTGRHRITLHVGTSGLTLTVFGIRMHTLRVPWGDIESIGIVVRQHPSVSHSLVVWLRPGARPPRSLWWPFPKEYGGLRLVSLEGSRLDTTPEQLDQVIAHHAGHRHSRIQRLA